ncbi:hypothetical protein [Dyadobacter jejuensis]|nr:hypothetical protein [Dyadobacter jejuensis]
MHKKQELRFLAMMRLEVAPALRKLCACGHISSVLCQKEIEFLYDSARNCFDDGDLRSIYVQETNALKYSDIKYGLQQIYGTQQELLRYYNEYIEENILNEDSHRICQDHYVQLLKLDASIKKELRSFDLQIRQAYLVVA